MTVPVTQLKRLGVLLKGMRKSEGENSEHEGGKGHPGDGNKKDKSGQPPLPQHGVDFPHSMVSADHLKDVFMENQRFIEQRKMADSSMQGSADPIIRGDHHHKLAKYIL